MAQVKTVIIAAILAGIASASLATVAQAENRHGTLPSRMMMKKHAMKSQMMKRQRMMMMHRRMMK